MRTRFARYLGAHCAIVAMLFGQMALAAYAYPAQGSIARIASSYAVMDAEAGHVPCPAMLSPGDAPQANACEVHCNDGVTSLVQPDWPTVTLSALPVPTLALAQFAAVEGSARVPLAPLPGAPPPTLRFCRLLI